MKKIIAFVLCLSVLFTLAASTAFAKGKDDESYTVHSENGFGQGTSCYCTTWINAKTGYYYWATCTVIGKYKVDDGSPVYTETDTAEGTGGVGKKLTITARCWARYDNHKKVGHDQKNVKGRQYKAKK